MAYSYEEAHFHFAPFLDNGPHKANSTQRSTLLLSPNGKLPTRSSKTTLDTRTRALAELEREWSDEERENTEPSRKKKRVVSSSSDTETDTEDEAPSAPWVGEQIPTNHRVPTGGKTLPRGVGALPSDEPAHGLLNAKDIQETEADVEPLGAHGGFDEPPEATTAEAEAAPIRYPFWFS